MHGWDQFPIGGDQTGLDHEAVRRWASETERVTGDEGGDGVGIVALDGQAYFYDVEKNGEGVSFGVTGTVGYDVTRRLRAVLAVEGGITPQFEKRGQIVARLEYSFFKSF